MLAASGVGEALDVGIGSAVTVAELASGVLGGNAAGSLLAGVISAARVYRRSL